MNKGSRVVLLFALLCTFAVAEWHFLRPPNGYYYTPTVDSNRGRAAVARTYKGLPASLTGYLDTNDCLGESLYCGSTGCQSNRECSFTLINTDDDEATSVTIADPNRRNFVTSAIEFEFDEAEPFGPPSSDEIVVFDDRAFWIADVSTSSDDPVVSAAAFVVGEVRKQPEYTFDDPSGNEAQWLLWSVYTFAGEYPEYDMSHFSGVVEYPYDDFTARMDTVAGPLVFDLASIDASSIGDNPLDASILIAGQSPNGTFWYAAPMIDSSTTTSSYMPGGQVTSTTDLAIPFGIIRAPGGTSTSALAWVLCEEDNGLSVKHFSASAGSLTYVWSQHLEGPAMRYGPCTSGGYNEFNEYVEGDCPDFDDLVPWNMTYGSWAETDDNIIVSMASTTHVWTVVLTKTTVAADIFTANGQLQSDYKLSSTLNQDDYYGGWTPDYRRYEEDRVWADGITVAAEEKVGLAYVITTIPRSDLYGYDERVSWSLIVDFDAETISVDYPESGNYYFDEEYLQVQSFSPYTVIIMGIPAPSIGGDRVLTQWHPDEVSPRLLASPGIDRWANRLGVAHMEYNDELEPDWAYFFGIFVAATALHLAMGGIVFGCCFCCARMGKRYEDDAWNLNDRLGMQYCSPKGCLMFCCTNPYRPMAEDSSGPTAPSMVVTPADDNGWTPPNAVSGGDGRRLSSRSNNSRNSRRSQNSKRSNRSARSKKSSNGGSSGKSRSSSGGKSGGRSSNGKKKKRNSKAASEAPPPAYDDLSFSKLPY